MQLTDKESYEAMIRDAELITSDGYGPKVYRLRDGCYLKLFRQKRLMSLAALYPYALRFKFNAEKLTRLGVMSLKCSDVFSIPAINRTAVCYQPMQGKSLRDVTEEAFPFREFANFFASLHERGIYFRSCHLGNIIQNAQHQFGLIDVADMRFYRRPLSWRKRARNFRHLLRYESDCQKLKLENNDVFWQSYFAATHLTPFQQNALKRSLVLEDVYSNGCS